MPAESHQTTTKKSKLTGTQKAAILLMALGTDIAAEILRHLNESEVERITFEIAKLEKVDAETKEKVLKEFEEALMAQDYILQGGVDYAREVLERALGTQKAIELISKLASSLQTRPFEFLKRVDPAHILNFIQNEHPQTIALILCYMDPQKAAQLLSMLPPEIQPEVARRIATMDRTSPEILRDVERVLEKKFSSLGAEDFTSVGGVEALVKILNFVDRSTEKAILERLEEEDPELAEEVKSKMFVFEDIVLLTDRDVQKVLREVDTAVLAKALKAVDDEVKEKIFKNMSKRAAALLKEEMEYMGPIRLRDVEEAQQHIVNIIRKLEEQGEIVIARGGEDEIIV